VDLFDREIDLIPTGPGHLGDHAVFVWDWPHRAKTQTFDGVLP
jgi:hypothetical protein